MLNLILDALSEISGILAIMAAIGIWDILT